MASLGNDADISLLGEALEKLMASGDGQPDEPVQMGAATEFHRYMDLPAELREQIRIEAFEYQQSCKQMSVFAAVSKEWQQLIEKNHFKTIRIDPMIEDDISIFKAAFTQEARRSLLHRLNVMIDDRMTGPWHSAGGLSQISLLMANLGRIFRFISTWACRSDYNSFAIDFLSLSTFDPGKDEGRHCETSSLWTESQLNRATKSGELPTDMPLWAINSEFPASLDIAKYLALPVDCLPLRASMALVQTMSKLRFVSFRPTFQIKSADGIERFSDFIDRMPNQAPNLGHLYITSADDTFAPDTVTESIRRLTNSLRDYSQQLSSLYVGHLYLHQSFFEPFADERELGTALLKWRWPDLKSLEISCGNFGAYVGPGEVALTPAELFIAAGRAATNMPRLSHFNFKIREEGKPSVWEKSLYISRSRGVRPEDPRRANVRIEGFSRDEDEQILAAFVPFLGGKARYLGEATLKNWPLTRNYEAVPESSGAKSP